MVGPLVGGRRRGRQLRRRVARRPLDPRSRGVPGDRRHRRPRPARGVPRPPPDRPRFLQVSTDEVYGSVDEGHAARGRAARAALAVRGGQGGRRAARPELRHHPRRRRRRDPRLEHVRAVPPSREAHPAVRHQRPRRPRRCRSTATACSGATGCTSPTTRPRSTTSCATARPARPTTSPGRRNGPTATSSRSCSSTSASRGRSSVQVEDRPGHDRRYAMDGAKLAGLGWRPRTAFEDGLAATVDWYRANEAWWRAARSGDWDGWYARQYGQRLATGRDRPATAPRTRRPRLMRVAVTGRGRPSRERARRRPRRRAVHRPGRADRLGAATRSTSTRPTGSGRGSTATGPRSSSTPRPGPMSTAAPSIRTWPSAATAIATGVLAAACADARRRPPRRLDQRGLRRDAAGRPAVRSRPTRPSPGNPYGASKLAGERLAAEAFADATRRRARDRPDGLAVRGARARLPEPHPRRRRAGARPPASRSARSATSGGPRPTRPTSPTRSSSCSPTTPIAGIHHLVNGAVRDARRLGPLRRRAAPASTSRSSNVPASTWERPSRPPRWGVLAPTPLPSGEPLRAWPDAMADYAPTLLRARRARA